MLNLWKWKYWKSDSIICGIWLCLSKEVSFINIKKKKICLGIKIRLSLNFGMVRENV
jgi:hypothetical protein